MKKFVQISIIATALLLTSSVSAHVSVKPAEVGIGKYQNFTVGVPVEKDVATTQVRLVIPEGLASVMPNVKGGWQIEIMTDTNDEKLVKEIVWKGGTIPKGFRDEFVFSAKAPGSPTKLVWKAYQTYADGTIVSWENDPAAEQPKKADGTSDFSSSGPYSATNIIDDLSVTTTATDNYFEHPKLPLALAGIALLLSFIALLSCSHRRPRATPTI